MKNSSKSQIGIFVVIAVIIVAIGILFFSLNSDSLNFFRDQDGSYQVKEYVETCLDIELKEAQRQIGLHGGWLYLPENKNVQFIDRNTQSQLVPIGKGFDFFRQEIPYWYYYDDGSESFNSQAFPRYDDDLPYSIKNQLKRYVDENLEKRCIKKFVNFEDLYDIKYDSEEIETTIKFKNEDIIIELELPILVHDINKNESDYFDYYDNKQYNKIQVPYYIARDIVRAEKNTSFIEKRMMQFLGLKMDYRTRDTIPPTYEFSIEGGPDFRPWKISEVEQRVKEILSSNINLIQFHNTKTSENYNIPDGLEDNQFANSFYSLYEKDYLSESSLIKELDSDLFERYEDYSVDIFYETFYPINFKLSPSLGNVILMPNTEYYLGGILPFVTNEYQAVYEFTTPVLLEIKDAKNLNDNFVFNLAIEANVAHNSPLKENLDISSLELDIPEPVTSLVCNPSQFISRYVSLNITDRINYGKNTGERGESKIGVDDAFVTFDCKGFSTCYMGQTKINGPTPYNNVSRLRFQLPINCNPGTLEISKVGHKTLVIDNLNPNLNEEISLGNYYMDSQKEFDLVIDILDGTSYDRPRGVKKEETGFLILTNLEDDNIVQVIEFDNENQNDLKIKLLPGNYNLKGFLMYNKEFSIPSKCVDVPDGGVVGTITGKTKCVTIPQIDLETWISGGVEIESFEVSYSDVILKNKFKIRLLDFGIPETFDEFSESSELMGDLESKSLEPIFN